LRTTNKALFLDRDGVINIDHGYVHKRDEFQFVDGIFEFASEFYRRGYQIFVVTNQSGIARGYYSEDDFRDITKFMESKFQRAGVKIEKTYHCPCHPKFSEVCECRKPKPTMLLQARDEFRIELSQSLFVGDNITDIEAGESAGVGYNYLFSQNGKDDRMDFDAIVKHFFKLGVN
jgi:D-glycero-D-manno-heptose 1,7-bisphosphate phosphatase